MDLDHDPRRHDGPAPRRPPLHPAAFVVAPVLYGFHFAGLLITAPAVLAFMAAYCPPPPSKV